jgi:hypothetical protein
MGGAEHPVHILIDRLGYPAHLGHGDHALGKPVTHELREAGTFERQAQPADHDEIKCEYADAFRQNPPQRLRLIVMHPRVPAPCHTAQDVDDLLNHKERFQEPHAAAQESIGTLKLGIFAAYITDAYFELKRGRPVRTAVSEPGNGLVLTPLEVMYRLGDQAQCPGELPDAFRWRGGDGKFTGLGTN